MSNHAKDAQHSVNASSELSAWEAEERLIFATRAQAQATLALAEEQRTANLMDLYNLGGPDAILTGLDYGVLAEQIKERLGVA